MEKILVQPTEETINTTLTLNNLRTQHIWTRLLITKLLFLFLLVAKQGNTVLLTTTVLFHDSVLMHTSIKKLDIAKTSHDYLNFNHIFIVILQESRVE